MPLTHGGLSGLAAGAAATFNWIVGEDAACPSITRTVTITNNGVYAGEDTELSPVCTSTATLAPPVTLRNGTVGAWVLTGGVNYDKVGFDNSGEVDGNTVVTAGDPNAELTNLEYSTYTLRWLVNSADGKCYDEAVVTLPSNGFTVRADMKSVNGKHQVCDDHIAITASPRAPKTDNVDNRGEWSVITSGVETTSTDNVITITGIKPTATINLKWTEYRDGCSADSTVTIENIQPSASAQQYVETCDGDANLVANESEHGTGHWEVVPTYSGTLENADQVNATLKNIDNAKTSYVNWVVVSEYDESCTTIVPVEVVNFKYDVKVSTESDITCKDKITVYGDLPENYTGVWTTSDGGDFDGETSVVDQTKTVVTNLHTGINHITWTLTPTTQKQQNCPQSDTKIVINNAAPTAVITTEPHAVCDGNVTLKASNPNITGVSGEWACTIGGVSIPDESKGEYEISLSGLAKGVNTFTWQLTKVTDGYDLKCTSNVAEITINNNMVNAGEDEVVSDLCDDFYTVSATKTDDNANAYWSSTYGATVEGSSETTTTALTAKFENIPATGETFVWTIYKGDDDNRCQDSKNVTVYNNYVPATIVAGFDNRIVCTSDHIELRAESIEDYSNAHGHWEIEQCPDNKMPCSDITFDNNDNTSNVVSVSGLDKSGTYKFKWVVSKTVGGVDVCPASAIATIVNNAFTTDAENNPEYVNNRISICETSRVLNATPAPTGYVGTWTGGDIQNDDVHNPNATAINIPQGGDVTLTWSVVPETWTDDVATHIGCSAESNVIIYNNFVKAIATAPESVCEDKVAAVGNNTVDDDLLHGYWTKFDENQEGDFSTDTDEYQVTYEGFGSNKRIGLVWHLQADYLDPVTGNVAGYCEDQASVFVTNNNFALTINADDVTDNCSDTYKLSGGIPGDGAVGTWECNNGVTYVSSDLTKYPNGQNDPNVTIEGLSNKTPNTFVWTVEYNNCINKAQVTITNNSVDDAEITTAGGNHSTLDICSDTYVVQAVPVANGSGVWSSTGSAHFVDEGSAQTTVDGFVNNTPTKVIWTVSRQNGTKGICSKSDDITITSKYFAAEIYGDNEITICSDKINSIEANDSKSVYQVEGRWSSSQDGVITYNNDLTDPKLDVE